MWIRRVGATAVLMPVASAQSTNMLNPQDKQSSPPAHDKDRKTGVATPTTPFDLTAVLSQKDKPHSARRPP